MRTFKLSLVAVASLATIVLFKARAEGGCPAGMYPIHSPGVMGCAPIPRRPEPPRPRRLTRWGALVTDVSGSGINGVSDNEKTERRATKVALDRCRNSGGKKCEVSATYSDACFYVAAPYQGDKRLPGRRQFAWGADASEAEATALRDCSDLNGAACRIEYSACSLPVSG